MPNLRSLPAVDKLLKTESASDLIESYGRPLTLDAVRHTLDDVRARFVEEKSIPSPGDLLLRTGKLLENWTALTLRPAINATGVIVHTNLGRAPLSQAAIQAMQDVALGYSNLEYDLKKGKRGSRAMHVEALIRQLTGAEAALVVNNNASAVMLALSALARRRRVVISRTQLIEIGGGFRIPDVMKQSGAKLVEIGTTNRVHLRDYEKALDEQSIALVLTAHWSNFRIIGFTAEPDKAELAALAHRAGVPMVEDLGSGTFLDTARYGLEHEPTVQEILAAGVDLVTFSGDKLLGGPQAGIIAGRADLVARLKKRPLARAVRADKLCLAALSATLLHYLKDEAERKIPVWWMISSTTESIRARVESWANSLGQGQIIPGKSAVGGGSLPGEILSTYLLALKPRSPKKFLARLRDSDPPIIARVQDNRVVLDPRTVMPEQEADFLDGMKIALMEAL